MKFDLVTDIVFTILVSLVMTSMKVPKRGSLPSVFHNITFWIYSGFWLKTIFTIIRIPVYHTGAVRPVLILIWFNWSGSFIATLSVVIPFEFVRHHLKHGSFAAISNKNRLVGCVTVAILYAIALLITAVVIGTDTASPESVLFVWRVYFFANAAVEVGMIFWSMVLIKQLSKDPTKSRGTLRHLMITLYMRGGLAAAIMLKFFHALSVQSLALVHLWFIFSGLLGFHFRTTNSTRGTVSVSTVFRRTEQLMVLDPGIMLPTTASIGMMPIAMFGSPSAAKRNEPTLASVEESSEQAEQAI